MALLAPLFLFVVFSVVQASVYYLAVNSARSAAGACAETTRLLTTNESQGQDAASQVLRSVDSLREVNVTVSRGTTNTSCTVSGRADILIPIPMPAISKTVALPTERITQP